MNADSSASVCSSCFNDSTPKDYGIGYNLSTFSSRSPCCGNDANEYYVKTSNFTACCDSINDCADISGACRNSGSVFDSGKNICFSGKIDICSSDKLCSGQNGFLCSFDGSSYAYRQKAPKELCLDGADNDCDGKIDKEDSDC